MEKGAGNAPGRRRDLNGARFRQPERRRVRQGPATAATVWNFPGVEKAPVTPRYPTAPNDAAVNDLHLGRLLRMRRLRHGWRLADVARRSRLGIATVTRGEHGVFASLDVARRHAAALDLRLEWRVVGRGGEVARTLDEEHAAIVEVVAGWLRTIGLEVAVEASYAIYGERGRIDLLGWDPEARMVCLVEAKTELTDVQALLGGTDVRERLAPRIADERGWPPPSRVVSLLALADAWQNRVTVARHRATFGGWSRAVFREGSCLGAGHRQLVWIPSAAAGRAGWLAARRRVQRRPS